jgi:hypothetical protein
MRNVIYWVEKGWDGHITESLVKFINENKGQPQ